MLIAALVLMTLTPDVALTDDWRFLRCESGDNQRAHWPLDEGPLAFNDKQLRRFDMERRIWLNIPCGEQRGSLTYECLISPSRIEVKRTNIMASDLIVIEDLSINRTDAGFLSKRTTVGVLRNYPDIAGTCNAIENPENTPVQQVF